MHPDSTTFLEQRLTLRFFAGISLLPLVITVNSNYNVVITACLTVLIGSLRSVKPMPPTVSCHQQLTES